VSPETIAVVGAVVTAAITAGPSYLIARRARGAAQQEGEATREAVTSSLESTQEAVNSSLEVVVARLAERIDAHHNATRTDIRDLREDVQELRSWTAGHTAEHLLINNRRDLN
jgi:hypothetical protein